MPCSIEVMPAAIASLMPDAAMACAAVRRPAFRASSMAARISSSVSWGEPGSTPGGHDTAGGDDLDDVGARLQRLAHRLARVVGTVRLAGQPVAVPARHAHRAARPQDARGRG